MKTCVECGEDRPPEDWPEWLSGETCRTCRERTSRERAAKLEAMPTALYRLYDELGDLLYVGITCRPKRRWQDHAKEKAWWSQVVDKQLQWFDARSAAEAAEVHAIVTSRPRYNAQWNEPGWVAWHKLQWLKRSINEEEREIRRRMRRERRRRALADLDRMRLLLRVHSERSYSAPATLWHECHRLCQLGATCTGRHLMSPAPGMCVLCPGEPLPCGMVREVAARYAKSSGWVAEWWR